MIQASDPSSSVIEIISQIANVSTLQNSINLATDAIYCIHIHIMYMTLYIQ